MKRVVRTTFDICVFIKVHDASLEYIYIYICYRCVICKVGAPQKSSMAI